MQDRASATAFVARDALLRFAERCGEGALRLAMHAAVPQVLRPDVLHLLRLNFVREADAASSEADVLLAEFSEPLGAEYFEFSSEARRQLLDNLHLVYSTERPARSARVGAFLLEYGGRQASEGARDPLLHQYLELQRWVALGFSNPDAAAAQFARALATAEKSDGVARLQLGGLAPALKLPLARYPELLAYAEGLHALARGEIDRAEALLTSLPDQMKVRDVKLSPAAVLKLQRRGAAAPEPPPPAPASEPSPEGLMRVPPPPRLVVGRDALIAQVSEALVDVPLVVLLGPAGVGKLTVARAVAASPSTARLFPGGIYWGESDWMPVDRTASGPSRLVVVEEPTDLVALADALRAEGRRTVVLATSCMPQERMHPYRRVLLVPRLDPDSMQRLQGANYIDSTPYPAMNPLSLRIWSRATDFLRLSPASLSRTEAARGSTIDRVLERCGPEAWRLLASWPSKGRFAEASALSVDSAVVERLERLGLIEPAGSLFELHPVIRARAARWVQHAGRPRVAAVVSEAQGEWLLPLLMDLDVIADFRVLEDAPVEAYSYDRLLVASNLGDTDVVVSWLRAAAQRCWPCIALLGQGASLAPEFADTLTFSIPTPQAFHDQRERLLDALVATIPPLGDLFGVPPLPGYAHSDPELAALVRSTLLAPGDRRRLVLHGPAGVGKTVLAVSTAHHCAIRRAFPGGIRWLQPPHARAIKQELEPLVPRREGVLIILDDVQDPENLEEIQTTVGPSGALLITTRHDGVAAFGSQVIEMGQGRKPVVRVERDVHWETLLTARERRVALLAVGGLRHREIAEQLAISEGTAKKFMQNVFAKLGVSNRAQLTERIAPPQWALSNPGTGARVELSAHTSVGRDAAQTLKLSEYNDAASKQHAQIRWQGDGFYLSDHSKNGTWLNGRRLRDREACRLQPGDALSFGMPTGESWFVVDTKPPPSTGATRWPVAQVTLSLGPDHSVTLLAGGRRYPIQVSPSSYEVLYQLCRERERDEAKGMAEPGWLDREELARRAGVSRADLGTYLRRITEKFDALDVLSEHPSEIFQREEGKVRLAVSGVRFDNENVEP